MKCIMKYNEIYPETDHEKGLEFKVSIVPQKCTKDTTYNPYYATIYTFHKTIKNMVCGAFT